MTGQPRRVVVGDANAAAVEALSHPETWPYRTAVLCGEPRSGKSLLAKWFMDSGMGDAIDDADKMDETALFHRWNRAQADGVPLLLTTTLGAEGAVWSIALPDLRSRMGGSLWVEIDTPDDAMLADLIAAHAEARGLILPDDGLRYLASRCERSHMGAERLVAEIDRISLERKCAPGAAVWREALEVMIGPDQPSLL
ncbi:P-loop NTPase family protein [Novosphingobium ovatum]|nr:ATPase [Novosphingobium ovatum]